ncbi:Ribosomal lysine N-methyltransferase [Paramyrothecium foliicola]|nr:Ribosomal lysine N-methyltransferase [Paramyrothecium foliicola]
MGDVDYSERTVRFLQWFKSHPKSFFSDSIQIVDLRGRNAGRGIVATSDIAAEATLFTIPREAIISVETSDLPQKLPHVFGKDVHDDPMEEDEDTQLDSWTSLILVMMYENLLGDASRWKQYFDVLPETFDTPMFWSDQELDELQASATRAKIGKDEAEKMFSSKLLPVIRRHSEIFTSSQQRSDAQLIQLAHRMGSTIMSYAFDLENEDDKEDDASDGWVEDRDGKSLMGMVPMADILNADAEFNAHVNHGEEDLTVTSLRPIKAGEEILNYYGPHPNSELLRRYGYVTPKHSRYDVVEIPWEAVEQAVASELKVSGEILEQARNAMDEDEVEDVFVLERETGEPDSDGTFTGPAELTVVPEDLQRQLKSFLKYVTKLSPDTIPDKRKRAGVQLAIMAKVVQIIKSRYSTSIAEDELLLQRPDLSGRYRMAIEVRLGEKRLLREAENLIADLGDPDALGESSESHKRSRVSN